jgi:ABC-type Fe3+-hydroxamate transport system substrate-binding protein
MRVISLCPSLTELVFDLGAGDTLVGRTKFCVHPTELVGRVEKVGGTKNPKVARIIELAPDLVLLNEEENRREDADALAAAGIRCHVSFPKTAADTADMVRSIGAALSRRDDAERVALDIESRAERARLRARGMPAIRFAYLIWRDPLMTVNGDTFVSALLTNAGGENVFASHTARYPSITPGELRASEPDIVLLSTEPFPFKEQHADEIARATGVVRDRFRVVDGERLSWHGSRTPAGIDYAADIITESRPIHPRARDA